MSRSKPSLSPTPRANVRRKAGLISPNRSDAEVTIVKVKKEQPSDEIKEYAATAMSELLGWYGYDKVDSRCTRGLNLDHFATSAKQLHQQHHQHQQQPQQLTRQNSCRRNSPIAQTIRASKSPQSRTTSRSPPASSISIVSSNRDNDGTQTSPPLSLRTAPASPRVLENSDSASDTPDSSTTCSWCGRAGGTWERGGSGSLACGITSNSGRFCSEACFAAGRRAAFKRARTCDWCRHVRHSVSYVDFQDGESQLQFCSDKCLNQYKMNIFCRETQAHLALHGVTTISNNTSSAGTLITPELWLRDCRSPPPSPDIDEALVVDDEPTVWPSTHADNDEKQNDELMVENNIMKCSTSPTSDVEIEDKETDEFLEETEKAIKASLKDEEDRKRQAEDISKTSPINDDVNTSRIPQSSPEISKKIADNCSRSGTIYLKDMRKLLGRETLGKPSRHVSYRTRKITKSPTWLPESQMTFQSSSHGGFPVNSQPPFLSHQIPQQFNSRPVNQSNPMNIRPPTLHSLPPKISPFNSQTNILPPVTILVPYPIPIPIPLPIPIPIPLFAKFFNSRKHDETCEMRSNTTTNDETAAAAAAAAAAPEDLSQRSKTNMTTKIMTPIISLDNDKLNSDSSTSSSSTATSCINFSATKTNQVSPVLTTTPRTTRPLRKRRRMSGTTNDETDMRLKRRSKFVPV